MGDGECWTLAKSALIAAKARPVLRFNYGVEVRERISKGIGSRKEI